MSTTLESPGVTREPTTRDRVVDGCREAAHLSHEAKLLKSLAKDTMEEAVHAVKVGFRRSARKLEDLKDDATTRVRRRPLAAVGAAFGIGVGLGAVAVWMTRAGTRVKARTADGESRD